MTENENAQPAANTPAPLATNQQLATATPAGAQNTAAQSQEHMIPKHRFDEVNNELKRLRDESEKAAKAAKDAEEKKLTDQAEWQKLADQRQARIAALEPLEVEHSALTERIAAAMNAEIKDWPEEVKALAPVSAVSPVAMLDWLEKHRPLAAKLAEKETPKATGNRPAPRSGTVQPNEDQQRQQRQAQIHRAF